MYNTAIFKKIQLLSYVMDDIKELDDNIANTTDPSLLIQYRQEMTVLIEELSEVSLRILSMIEEYMEECKKNDEPIMLDFYRVYKQLSKAFV